jgi:hypothetical protein
MKFSKEEKEIVKVIVKYANNSENIASAFNASGLLEKRGVAIVDAGGATLVFFKIDMHPDFFPNAKSPYMSLLLNLIERLVQNRLIVCGNSASADPLVVGAKSSRWEKLNTLAVNDTEAIILKGPYKGWYDKTTRQIIYWEWNEWGNQLAKVSHYLHCDYCVSEELKDLVKNNFKTDEEIRFAKQQLATWVSIAVAILLGILGIIF